MQNDLTIRFLRIIKKLKEAGEIKSYRSLAIENDISPSMLNEVLKKRSNISYAKIKKLVDNYSVNKDFILHGRGDMFVYNYPHDNEKIKIIEEKTSIHLKLIDLLEKRVCDLEEENKRLAEENKRLRNNQK